MSELQSPADIQIFAGTGLGLSVRTEKFNGEFLFLTAADKVTTLSRSKFGVPSASAPANPNRHLRLIYETRWHLSPFKRQQQ